jgi:cob(I)alamin adenosyltransferase
MAGQEDNMPAQVMGTLTSLQSRLGGTMADLANPKLSNKERQVLEQDRARLESQIDQIQKGWRANRGAVAAGGGSSGGAADYIWKDGKLVKSGK